jgi:hypothetical protein
MTTFEFATGSEEWHKYRKRALNDLYWFCANVLGLSEHFALYPETHILPLRFAERKTGIADLDDAPYQLILWPRDTGKSSCITVGRTLQRICANPDTAIMIANEKEETAADFIAGIKHQIQTNEFLRHLFPEIVPPDFNKVVWAATRAEVNRTTGRPEPTVDCIGVGGTKTGKHYDMIVCDDLISRESMENARSGNWTIMHKVNRWVNQLPPLLSHSAKPFPQITFIGTRWWTGDTYEHIEESLGKGEEPKRYRIKARLPSGKVVSRDAYRVGNLAVIIISAIENGKYAFPEIWSEEKIQDMLIVDPELAACNLFNNPSNAAIRTFQDDWLRYWRYSDAEGRTITYPDEDGALKSLSVKSLYRIITVDPAASSNEEGARNAIVVLGTDQASGKHFVLDVIASHDDPEDMITNILNTAQRWGVNRVYIELAGQQLYVIQWTEKEARRRNYPLTVEHLKPGGRNKDLRISGLTVPFKNGALFVHRSQTALIVDEYRHYRPGAKKRDVLDALAYALEVAPKPVGNRMGMDPEQRAKMQLNHYLQRRGMR